MSTSSPVTGTTSITTLLLHLRRLAIHELRQHHFPDIPAQVSAELLLIVRLAPPHHGTNLPAESSGPPAATRSVPCAPEHVHGYRRSAASLIRSPCAGNRLHTPPMSAAIVDPQADAHQDRSTVNDHTKEEGCLIFLSAAETVDYVCVFLFPAPENLQKTIIVYAYVV